MSKKIAILILLIISISFVYPAITTPGIWSSFDSPFHITMIAQFHYALSYLHIPVIWTEGVANYGLPFGIIAHPLTSYTGGLLTFITKDPVVSYKILWFVFSIFSTWGMYRLLRRFTNTFPSIAGTILYTFSAYRILNLYIRGALPEFAAAAWLPFLLYELYESIKQKNILKVFIKLTLWYALIVFTHPMFLLFSGVLTGFFFLYYRPRLKYWIVTFLAALMALSFNAFYLLPLNLELKYFYLGQSESMLATNNGMTFDQIVKEEWEYTCSSGDTPELRCNRVQAGVLEVGIILLGFVFYLKEKNKNKKRQYVFLLLIAAVTSILVLRATEPLYQKILILGSIQFPYRFLNLWLLTPPIILALFLDSVTKYKKIIILCIISGILFVRLPQLYVKNNYNPDRKIYYHNKENIHSLMMNTIWMAESKTYPEKKNRLEIIEGKGNIKESQFIPTKHESIIQSDQEIKIANYTFFFPGWHAYIDGKETTIEWQDPHNRGYMLINVPPREHHVSFIFKDTKIRLVGKIMSLVTFLGFILFWFLYNSGKLKMSVLKRYIQK